MILLPSLREDPKSAPARAGWVKARESASDRAQARLRP